MHSTVPATLLAVCMSTAAVTPAGAGDITPAQAAALQAQAQGWLSNMLGQDTRPAKPAIQVTPEGDHYRIELPFGTTRSGHPGPVTLSASAQPAEGGRWIFEGPKVPSTTTFTLDIPGPARDGQKGPGPTVPVEFTLTTESGDSRGTFDPTFATPSTLSGTSRDMQISARSALINQLTKFERTSSTNTLQPSGPNRVDFTTEATVEGYTTSSQVQGSAPEKLSAQRVNFTGEITGLSRNQAATMIPVVVRLVRGLLAAPPRLGGDDTAAGASVDPQLLRAIVQALPDLASEFSLNETLDGVALSSETRKGAANQVRIGMGAKSEGGLLQAYMDLGLDGLVLPDVVPGAMADLLPRTIALRPVLTGVPTEELIHWLGAMTDANGSVQSPSFVPLLLRAGVSAGLDSFAVDVGGANFAGSGKFTATSSDDFTGHAQVTAANFDDLIARVNAIPELASVLPLFVYAKGLSQMAEGHLIWNMAYRDNKVLVNGTDLSAMTGRPPSAARPGPDSR